MLKHDTNIFLHLSKQSRNTATRSTGCTADFNVVHQPCVKTQYNRSGLALHHTPLTATEKERLRHANRKRGLIFKQSKAGDVLR